MSHEEAIAVVRKTYPNSVIRKRWMPKRGKYWYEVISELSTLGGWIGWQVHSFRHQ